MTTAPTNLLNYIRVLVGATWRDDPREDAQLLARFVENRDEGAFATLLGRHGPLVWRTCRRVLGEGPDTEDACQAVFLALARKADRLRASTLTGWLHRVAQQAALDIRNGMQRRRNLEQNLQAIARPKETDTERAELYVVLDEELAKLPEKLRLPLLLRYLEGKTLEEIGCCLGCTRWAISKRLVRGEAILREKLQRRGFGIGIPSVTTLLGNMATGPSIPVHLIERTAREAMAFRAGTLTGGAAETALSILKSIAIDRVVRMSWWMIVASVCSLGFLGAGWAAWKVVTKRTDVTKSAIVTAPEQATDAKHSKGTKPVVPSAVAQSAIARLDAYGDLLPIGAMARIGSSRLLQVGVDHLAFLADGKSFVAGGQDGTIRVWDLASGKELRRLQGYPDGVQFLAYSPVSQLVAFGDRDKQYIHLWNAVSGKEVFIQNLMKCQSPEGLVTSCPDGKLAILEQKNPGHFCLREVDTGEIRVEGDLDQPNPTARGVIWSSDGNTLALNCSDQEENKKSLIRILDSKNGRTIRKLQGLTGPIGLMTYSLDGRALAATNEKGMIHVWNMVTGEKLCQYLPIRGLLNSFGDTPCLIASMAFSPDSKTLITSIFTSMDSQTVVMRELSTGNETRHQLKNGFSYQLSIINCNGFFSRWENVIAGNRYSNSTLGHRTSQGNSAYCRDI